MDGLFHGEEGAVCVAYTHCKDFEKDFFGVGNWFWDLDSVQGSAVADVAFPGLHCGHLSLWCWVGVLVSWKLRGSHYLQAELQVPI